MPESFLGDGLIFEDFLPLAWSPGPLPENVMLARLNVDNQQLLGAEASLDEVRVHEALKDESQALLHELQRLEFKLNVLLRLTAQLARQNSALPPAHHVRLSSSGLEWIGDDAPAVGATGTLELYINASLPQALKFPATVVDTYAHSKSNAARMRFSGLNESVMDLIEKLIFRHHRRFVATSRLTITPRT